MVEGIRYLCSRHLHFSLDADVGPVFGEAALVIPSRAALQRLLEQAREGHGILAAVLLAGSSIRHDSKAENRLKPLPSGHTPGGLSPDGTFKLGPRFRFARRTNRSRRQAFAGW